MSLRKAAQQALDALEEYEKSYQAVADGLKPLRAALAENQSEDVLRMVEPVAYIHETGFLVRNPAATLTAGMKLYAAPPKREPLTNQEIFREYAALWQFLQKEDHLRVQDILKLARAIERAHGIGGEE